MSEIAKLRSRVEIDEEAAAWTWRMDSGMVSAADRQGFEAWLRQDPRHRRAMEELAQVWSALDGLSDAKRQEKIATFVQAFEWRLRFAPRWWPAAAAMLVVVVSAGLWVQNAADRRAESQIFATAVGQQRSVTLTDGSTVTLNTNTIVETQLERRARDVYLRKGEAHFQVAHDSSRPFRVHAGDAVVSAVGTEFDVRVRDDKHVEVLVNEGRVEVQPALQVAKPHAAMRALAAGQQLSTASLNYAVVPISMQRIASEMAWREGAIVFDGDTLSAAIAEIERYTDARIVISDARSAGLRVGGRFRTGDVAGFFAALQEALPVSVRRGDNGVIYIDPR